MDMGDETRPLARNALLFTLLQTAATTASCKHAYVFTFSVLPPCVSNGVLRRLQPAFSACSWPPPAILQHPPIWHHVRQPATANHQPALSCSQWVPISGRCRTNSTAESW